MAEQQTPITSRFETVSSNTFVWILIERTSDERGFIRGVFLHESAAMLAKREREEEDARTGFEHEWEIEPHEIMTVVMK